VQQFLGLLSLGGFRFQRGGAFAYAVFEAARVVVEQRLGRGEPGLSGISCAAGRFN